VIHYSPPGVTEIMHVRRAAILFKGFHRSPSRVGAKAVKASLRSGESLSDVELSQLLLAVARDADRQAFTVLFKHYAPRLKAFLMRTGLAPNMAEELAQETMLMVWRKASYFNPARASVGTWIFTIARNIRIDGHRKERGRSAMALEFEGETEVPSTEVDLLASEREAQIRSALASLSEEQALVVKLSFFNDKPHSEIATELGIPLGTVKSRVRLAMTKLRALLGNL